MAVILLTTPAEFRARAAECDAIALKQKRPSEREAWTFTARHWRLMADEVEAKRKPRRVPTTAIRA
jgi:hypothetical protein